MSTTAAPSSTDRIEEQVQLHHPRTRVWRALTTPDEFAAWFGVKMSGGTFTEGAHVRANMAFPGYEHVFFDVIIDEITPESRFAWKWHPNAMDASIDYSAEPRTHVVFTLEDTADGGTLVRVVESGFDALPESRRAAALLGNSKGWTSQLQKRLVAHLEADRA